MVGAEAVNDSDIVTRIRKRFPRPKDAGDGLLSNEAADEIERLRAMLAKIELEAWSETVERSMMT